MFTALGQSYDRFRFSALFCLSLLRPDVTRTLPRSHSAKTGRKKKKKEKNMTGEPVNGYRLWECIGFSINVNVTLPANGINTKWHRSTRNLCSRILPFLRPSVLLYLQRFPALFGHPQATRHQIPHPPRRASGWTSGSGPGATCSEPARHRPATSRVSLFCWAVRADRC